MFSFSWHIGKQRVNVSALIYSTQVATYVLLFAILFEPERETESTAHWEQEKHPNSGWETDSLKEKDE